MNQQSHGKHCIAIASIGECMIELQQATDDLIRQTFGGDTLNAAIYAARLGRGIGATVDYVTAVGKDRFSDRMVAFWEAEGVGSSMVLRQEGEKPGLYLIEVDEHGERYFSYWRGEAAAKRCFEYPESQQILERLEQYDAIYLSGITLAILTPKSRKLLIGRLSQLAAQGIKVALDCNFRPHLWSSAAEARNIYNSLLPSCHLVLTGCDELQSIFGQSPDAAQKHLIAKGIPELVVRNGSNPCTLCADGAHFTVETEAIDQVIDTTAAGDSFSGAYLLSRLHGCPPVQAARIANRMAAYVIAHRGAIAPRELMPDFTDLFDACPADRLRP